MCAGQSSVLSPLMSSVWLIHRSGWLRKAREISGALVGITDCFKLNFSLIGVNFFGWKPNQNKKAALHWPNWKCLCQSVYRWCENFYLTRQKKQIEETDKFSRVMSFPEVGLYGLDGLSLFYISLFLHSWLCLLPVTLSPIQVRTRIRSKDAWGTHDGSEWDLELRLGDLHTCMSLRCRFVYCWGVHSQSSRSVRGQRDVW